ncbi:MAG: hypothetical protein ABR556_12020 [Pyrinomonadaceae bacterium]
MPRLNTLYPFYIAYARLLQPLVNVHGIRNVYALYEVIGDGVDTVRVWGSMSLSRSLIGREVFF